MSISSGFGGVQVHLRIRTCGLDPDEQQPLYAGDQGDADDDQHHEHELDCATGDEDGGLAI